MTPARRMLFRIAEGTPWVADPDALGDIMRAETLLAWREYYSEVSPEVVIADYGRATIAAVIANAHQDKKRFAPKDFAITGGLQKTARRNLTDEQLKAEVLTRARLSGFSIKRAGE